MLDHRRPRRRSWAVLATTIALVLAGCGGGSPTTARPSHGVPDRVKVVDDVEELPSGQPPALDVVLGSELLHGGRRIHLRLPADALFPTALGTHDGTPIISTGLGSQLFSVAPDGRTTPLGGPHETYDHGPRLVPETGHVVLFDNDRGTARSTYTVLDASTGRELAVLRDTATHQADLSGLDPHDRAVVDVVVGDDDPTDTVAAVSPDGSLTVTDTTDDPDDPASPTLLTVRAIGGGRATTLRFPTRTADLAFESDDAFLVAVAVAGDHTASPERVVVRCTVRGDCERTTGASAEVSIAGSGGVRLGG